MEYHEKSRKVTISLVEFGEVFRSIPTKRNQWDRLLSGFSVSRFLSGDAILTTPTEHSTLLTIGGENGPSVIRFHYPTLAAQIL
jgi:hypothetical protein